ncbi:MAG: hypothetical protein AAF514_14620, partial [Verrucomicrobiota bacterium]
MNAVTGGVLSGLSDRAVFVRLSLMNRFRMFLGSCCFLLIAQSFLRADDDKPSFPAVDGFELKLWAREPLLRNPTSVSVDDLGRVYIAETTRRGRVDIDIRRHKEWVLEDLRNQSVDDLRRFFHRRMAPSLSDENAAWLEDRNGDGSHDWRDLRELAEAVRMLEDTDGDGTADRTTLVSDRFAEEVTGVVEGVMPFEDKVYVTVFPDLWMLKDLDGDGRADEQTSLFRGFGVHAALDGHDIHGLIMGPEGKLYFSLGDNGVSLVTREGTRIHYPNQGAIFRCWPDGRDLEVFCRGLRNPQEIAFNDFGDLFTVDNDGDL